ncbi:MAG: hypothetical protein JWL84_3695 [Rhodospirillales bacterium]|jgi:hypothetical protein|nr:hypothetical protein [Rhodospirillales bacterium]
MREQRHIDRTRKFPGWEEHRVPRLEAEFATLDCEAIERTDEFERASWWSARVQIESEYAPPIAASILSPSVVREIEQSS